MYRSHWRGKHLNVKSVIIEILRISEQTFLVRVVATLAGPWLVSPRVGMGSMAEAFKRNQS